MMGPDAVQHAIVTFAAAAAAWVVIRRVFTTMKPTGGSKCASCPSAQPQRHALTSEAKPLTLVR